jgi:pimeloyl-ACP methyl ester carboxylesterase
MPNNFQREAFRASLLMSLFLVLAFGATASTAAEALPAVRLWSIGSGKEQAYVITHGMGGTADGDRFHKLANAIAKMFPNACVVRVDWSERASATIYGLPNPYKVAASIDEVGDQAAELLQQEKIDPQRAIFIGESFGNWVNARIAQRLGGVQGILALNPANEGGYPLPDLRRHTKRSWSFHTYSVFDTTLEIAESDFWLETPARAGQWEQHVAGMKWLSSRLEAGDSSWLRMDKLLPKRSLGHFQALVRMDGLLSEGQLPRERPVPTQSPSNSADPLASDIAAAAN